MDLPIFVPRRYEGIEGLNPPSADDFKKLKSTLDELANSPMIPAKKPEDRLKLFLDHAKLSPAQARRLTAIWRSSGMAMRKAISEIECKSFIKAINETGLLEYGQPLPVFAREAYMFPLAFASRVGKPNGELGKAVHEVYETYSLDVGQVLSEIGRYYLTKATLEVKSDPKAGIIHVRLFQRSGGAPGDTVDEVYYGNLFVQDDTAYVVMFKDASLEAFFDGTEAENVNKGRKALVEVKDVAKIAKDKKALAAKKPSQVRLGSTNGKKEPEVIEAEAEKPAPKKASTGRKNLATMVLTGLSRGDDGLYDKFIGGQLGRGLGGATGVLAAPCVLYRVSNRRVIDVARKIFDQRQGKVDSLVSSVLKTNGAEITPALKAHIMREFAGQEGIMYGIDPAYAPVMSDLGIPVPRPELDDNHPQVLVSYDPD